MKRRGRASIAGMTAVMMAAAGVGAEIVFPPATLDALPEGFVARTLTFPVPRMAALAQSPISGHIYAVQHQYLPWETTAFYRIATEGPHLSAVVAGPLPGSLYWASGLAFDRFGALYVVTKFGEIWRGVDTDPAPAIDVFQFVRILDLPDMTIGTYHGVGGIAVGPDDKLYINSGSESHYGPEPDLGHNMRVLRCNLDGSGLETFCAGVRNMFGLAFRSDGALFSTENGPNEDCDYAEELNRLLPGRHYGFPYRFASGLSGGDASLVCTSDVPRVGPQPLPAGLETTPAWGNRGPDGVPAPGRRGYVGGPIYYGFEPHSAATGLAFYEPARMAADALLFPEAYHGRLFVARFGSSDSDEDVGFDLLTLRLHEEDEEFSCNALLTGLGRPVGVLCAVNGRVYILSYNQQTSRTGPGFDAPSQLIELRYDPAGTPTPTPPPAVELLVNPGFEADGAVLISPPRGWTAINRRETWDGTLAAATWGTLTTPPRSGAYCFGKVTDWGRPHLVLYQRVSVERGGRYRCAVYARTPCAHHPGHAGRVRLGADPAGGMDPDAPAVRWTEAVSAPGDYVLLSLEGDALVEAATETLTLFLEYRQDQTYPWNGGLFDDASVMLAFPPPLVPWSLF